MTLIKGSIAFEINDKEKLRVSVGYYEYGAAFIRFNTERDGLGYAEESIHEMDIAPLYELLGVMFDNSVSFEDLIEYCNNVTDER